MSSSNKPGWRPGKFMNKARDKIKSKFKAEPGDAATASGSAPATAGAPSPEAAGGTTESVDEAQARGRLSRFARHLKAKRHRVGARIRQHLHGDAATTGQAGHDSLAPQGSTSPVPAPHHDEPGTNAPLLDDSVAEATLSTQPVATQAPPAATADPSGVHDIATNIAATTGAGAQSVDTEASGGTAAGAATTERMGYRDRLRAKKDRLKARLQRKGHDADVAQGDNAVPITQALPSSGDNTNVSDDNASVSDGEQEAKESRGWTPGKFARKARAKLKAKFLPKTDHHSSDSSATDTSSDDDAPSSGGNGGFLRRKLRKGRAKLRAGRDRLRAKLSRKRRLHAPAPLGGDGGGNDPGHVALFGTLSLTVVRGEHLGRHAYVEVLSEGAEFRTAVAAADGDPWPNATFELPISDPTSDVHLYVMRERPALVGEKVLGRAVIPIVSLLDGWTGVRAPTRLWLSLYPACRVGPEACSSKLEGATRGVRGSGMPRPREPRGRVLVEVCLRAAVAPVAAYAQCEPFLLDSRDSDAGTDEDGDPAVEPRIIKGNIRRIKAALGPPALLLFLCTKFGSTVLWIVLYHLCFRAGLWQLPLFAFAAVVANGLLAARARRRRFVKEPIIVWEADIERPPKVSTIGKLLALKRMIGKLQPLTGKVADALECQSNALNFSDLRVTSLLLAVLFVMCCFCALVLSVAPTCLLVFGVLAVPAALLTAAAWGVLPKKSKQASTDGVANTSARAPTGGRVKGWAQHVLARVPNERELVHRHLCAIATEVVPPPQDDDTKSQ